MSTATDDPFDLSDLTDPIGDDDDLPTNLRRPPATAAAADAVPDSPPDRSDGAGTPATIAAPAASHPGVVRPSPPAPPTPATSTPVPAVRSRTSARGTSTAGGEQLTPSARHVYEELMAIGAPRPVVRPGFVDQLVARIEDGTAEVLEEWTEPSMFLSKSALATVLRCEGQALAYAAQPLADDQKLPVATAIGIAAHRAVQLTHTHPNLPTPQYVRLAIEASVEAEEQFAAFWANASAGTQSDVIAQVTSRTAVFSTSWPPLADEWEPRFEEGMVARVGRLKLSAKPDLVLGTPRPSGKQTVMVVDLKTGSLNDGHVEEAAWHALVATIRNGVPPFRSVVYSLAEGEWTTPADVTEDMLVAAADRVVAGTVARVRILTEARPPKLTPARHCAWCPVALTCEESTARPDPVGPEARSPLPHVPPPDAPPLDEPPF